MVRVLVRPLSTLMLSRVVKPPESPSKLIPAVMLPTTVLETARVPKPCWLSMPWSPLS